MRRGSRFLSAQNASASRDADSSRREDQISPSVSQRADPTSSQPPAQQPPAATGSRRGRLASQLANLNISSQSGDPPGQPPAAVSAPASAQPQVTAAIRQSSSGSDSPASNGSRLSRQGSNLSSGSTSVSEQFAIVEPNNYKAQLPKEASTAGMPIQLSVNYMTFDTTEGTRVEEYHVEFNPNIESIRLRYQLLRTDPARAIIGNVLNWTGTNLYLPIKLADKVTEFEAPHPVSNSPVKIKLVYVKTPPDSELMPFYNNLMHKIMNKLRYVVINRQHYSPMHKISVEQYKLEVWPGWITSIARLDGGIKLNVDASFRVLRLETVRDLLLDIRNRSRGVNLKEALESALIGTIIMTRYNNRAYRIDGIDLNKKPSDTFTTSRDNNRQISFVDYMKEHWNTQVHDVNQPMIVHKPKPKRGQIETEEVLLIPELCVTTGLTDEMRANFHIMKAIGDHTRLPPDVRESKLVEFLRELHTDERAKSVLSDWNLSVRPNLDVVSARRLETETVIFGNQRSFKVPDNVDWTRAATSGSVFKSVNIDSWVIMFSERDNSTAMDFLECVKEVSRSLGIKFCAPRIVRLPNEQPTTYINYGKREVKLTDQLVVILTPGRNQREDRYSACKRLYSCELPVPSQFIRCGTISNPQKLRAICQKIVIQIVSKVGGQPWAMKFPMKSFMIVGIDVYHDTIDRKKSCVGFVASMNEFTSSWWSRTFFQNSLEEIGQQLNSTLISAIRKYHALHGFVPQKIIVYRDGVGDGQLDTVLELEVAQTMNAIKFYMRDSSSGEAEPHVSYVIVQKRINTKMSLRFGNRVLNPLPGSYLDHTITHPEYNDFFLVSQHVNQGTVSPTKYIVLAETGSLKMMHHQKLAYKMTHMYYNWCGTIRVPAPCQYAHKLAYLTGQNIRQQASERLEDKLYYL